MELRHLRYFVTLAEELHFGRAAERLHIAQPPLSQQIQQLEKELGFELFHRTKRNVQLTEAGQVFLGEVQQILRQLQQAIQVGQQTSRGEVGQLVVGFVSSATYNILPNILRDFRNRVPGVRLELHELTTDQQLEWLRSGRLDVGFVRPPVEEDTFNWEIIFQESLMVALPETHWLANQSHVCLKSLANEPFILFPRILAPGLYDLIISLCQQAGFSPTVTQEAIQMQTIVSLVAAEMGVAIVPASLQNLQRTGVVYQNIQESTPKVAIAMIWRRNQTSPTVQRFLKVVRQFRELQEINYLG
ncbi:LysR family transcriptional regulator [Nostoc sp. CENA67]|uniref:LysR family transcriptional regulator n=1 Tax=Amazonocrinis nigriterrae CENA67 TaxID=2794033 RepID=A0A8J7HRJ2_9NOST|nr:LysR family transcriptional regulator [Amazonocrinis nigriterrae]MBH8564357.1 LysR family transcriptional regulator [Amazonocrinis nigriterrae CENA67]